MSVPLLLTYRILLTHCCSFDLDLSDVQTHNSRRNRVAQHIKTYIRYGEDLIDWAHLASVNLSRQS